MLRADQPEVEVEVVVGSRAGVLWALVTDIEVPVRFVDAYRSVTWVDARPGPRPGDRFVGRVEHPRLGRWDTTCRVVTCTPLRTFAWAVDGPTGPVARWRFDLAPDLAGTRLRLGARMGNGPAPMLQAIAARPDREERIVASWLDAWRRAMAAVVEGVRHLAEAGGPDATPPPRGRADGR